MSRAGAAPTAERDRGRMLGIIPDPTAVSRRALPRARLKQGGFSERGTVAFVLVPLKKDGG